MSSSVVVAMDGQTNWFEGVLLLAMYAILGIAFFYIPAHHPAGYDANTPAATTVPAAVVNH